MTNLTEIIWNSDKKSFTKKDTEEPVNVTCVGPRQTYLGPHFDMQKLYDAVEQLKELQPDSYELSMTQHDVLGGHYDYAPLENRYAFRLFKRVE